MRKSLDNVESEVLEIEMLIERLDRVNTTPSILTIIRTLATLFENSYFSLISIDGDFFAADSRPNDGRGYVFDFDTNNALNILTKAISYENETLIFKEKAQISTASMLGQVVADCHLGDLAIFGHKALGYIDPSKKSTVWPRKGREIKIAEIAKIKIEPISNFPQNELLPILPIDGEHGKSFLEHFFEEMYKKKTFVLIINTK